MILLVYQPGEIFFLVLTQSFSATIVMIAVVRYTRVDPRTPVRDRDNDDEVEIGCYLTRESNIHCVLLREFFYFLNMQVLAS